MAEWLKTWALDLESWVQVPLVAGHFAFLSLESTQLYPQNEEVFRDVKPSVPGDLVHISLRPFQALISHLNGGKPKGATKKYIYNN